MTDAVTSNKVIKAEYPTYILTGVSVAKKGSALSPIETQAGTSKNTASPLALKVKDGILVDVQEESSLDQAFRMENGTVLPQYHLSADQSLFPIGVDPQVHLRVPGQIQKETALTGLRAAIAGGVGALLTMPNTNPVLDCIDALQLAKDEVDAARQDYPVHVLYSGTISKGMKGKEASNYLAMKEWGIAALTDDGLGVESDAIMRDVFAYSDRAFLPVLQHAEFLGHKGVLAPGPVQTRLGIREYPDAAEWEMVQRDLELLKDFKSARYHVLHVSSAKTVELVAKAKQIYGKRVTAEVSPHHLFFNASDIDESNPAFKMNPPLRSESDQEVLIQALNEGVLDFVATDHAPHEEEVKKVGFKNSAYGTVGLETFLPTLITLHAKGLLKSWSRVWEVFASAGAQFLGIDELGFGSLAVGKPFRAAVFNIGAASKTFTEADLYGKSKNSCFIGSRLSGTWQYTFIGDRVFEPGMKAK